MIDPTKQSHHTETVVDLEMSPSFSGSYRTMSSQAYGLPMGSKRPEFKTIMGSGTLVHPITASAQGLRRKKEQWDQNNLLTPI